MTTVGDTIVLELSDGDVTFTMLITLFVFSLGAGVMTSPLSSVDRDPSSDLLAAQCRTRCLGKLQIHVSTE